MTPKEIKQLIENEVKEQVLKAKKDLAKKIEYKLEYTGEFAKTRYIMDVFDDWARF